MAARNENNEKRMLRTLYDGIHELVHTRSQSNIIRVVTRKKSGERDKKKLCVYCFVEFFKQNLFCVQKDKEADS